MSSVTHTNSSSYVMFFLSETLIWLGVHLPARLGIVSPIGGTAHVWVYLRAL